MSGNKTNDPTQKGQNKDNKEKGGFQDNTDPNTLVPPTLTDPESKYLTNSSGTSIQDSDSLARGGNRDRAGVNAAYGDGGDRPRSNPAGNENTQPD